jgi:RNA polymerase sigma-70 factor (ECF subfamily)
LEKVRTVFVFRYNQSVMDDTEIASAVVAGDKDAFGALVERYQRSLYYFVVGKVADDTEAKDIVQKTFVVAFQNMSDFRLGGSFFAWLKGIALNHCRNEWRRYQSQARMAGRLLEEKRAELELASLDARASDTERRIAALRECLEKLSPDEQAAVEMRFVQELSLAAIGEQMGRSAEAVRLFLYRIRQRLADCVTKRLSLRTP